MQTMIMLKLAERLHRRAHAIVNNEWRKYDINKPGPIPHNSTARTLYIISEELKDIYKVIKTKSIDKYADLFTLKEFESICKAGGFISSDGIGYYAKKYYLDDEIMVTSLIARPEQFTGGDINKDYTHVAWYNK